MLYKELDIHFSIFFHKVLASVFKWTETLQEKLKNLKKYEFWVWLVIRDPEASIPGFRDAKIPRDPGISGSRDFPMETLNAMRLGECVE